MFSSFLPAEDAERASAVLSQLRDCGLARFAVTGGVAMGLHVAGPRRPLPLRDIDIVVADEQAAPACLSRAFLTSHFHPNAPVGGLVLQLVQPERAVRVDLFSASGAILTRTETMSGQIEVVSKSDLLARAVRILLALADGPIAAKHRTRFARLRRFSRDGHAQRAWEDHRKPDHPEQLRHAIAQVDELIAAHSERLVQETFEQDVSRRCGKCEAHGRFALASPSAIKAVLGYC